MKNIKKHLLTITLFCITSTFAQNDNILWSSVQLQTKASDKLTLNFKPIFRFDDAISDFQNASIDIFANYKIGKGWSAQLSSRTWFIPNAKPRQFIWPDIAYGFTKGIIKIDNRLRYHLALDINDRKDPDFLRWSLRFMYNKGKIKPFFGIEPWFRLNGVEQWQRIRYMPGVNWKLNDTYSLSFTYWKEDSINLKPKISNNIWLVNLLVKI